MRVETLYTDSSGTYRVRADVKENNRSVHVIDIIDDEYGTEADFDDFSDSERVDMFDAILKEYDALDSDNPDDYNDESEDEETDNDRF
jgi:hypothetical protein